MSQTTITRAFEQWKAQQGATGEPVLLDEFVFANVPGLEPDRPVDRNETLPPAEQIVHRQAVSRKGVVNDNAVVHSVVLGADVGDFSFNWIGLINKSSGTLAMIVHAPLQQKLKTAEGQQGNVLTRSFLMEYNGAQAETGINTPAETWQIDFTARMAGMDERQRLENIDIFGAAAFFGDGWLVGKSGNQFYVTKGTGYVAGLRTTLAENLNITVTTRPVKVWLDVCWTGALTSVWGVQSRITVADNLADYVQNGVQHYVFAVAGIDENGNITDLRPKGTLNEQQASDALRKHEQSRNHPDATTREKGFVQLSSETNSDSESLAATPKAVKAAMDNANGRLEKNSNGSDIPDKAKFVENLGLKETLNPTKRVSIGNIGTGAFDGSTPCINIGDSDSGFIGSADGVLDIYCNSAKVGYIDGNGLHMLTDIHFDNARMTTNGDIFSSVWGNNWLSIWITNQLNTRGTIDWINSELA
ncbi:phage tail protein, partial [Salmonella enterica subsp. enterica serovar Javiana]|uniref:phage tail-collar fiber domain-containing protein n=2 Tax=Salmonella enterica TaxID=28901 RepID=UPI0021B15ED4